MFIKVTVILENTKLAELGVKEEITSPMRLRVDSIDAYRNLADDEGEILENECMVHMLTGASFAVKATIEELDELITKAIRTC